MFGADCYHLGKEVYLSSSAGPPTGQCAHTIGGSPSRMLPHPSQGMVLTDALLFLVGMGEPSGANNVF